MPGVPRARVYPRVCGGTAARPIRSRRPGVYPRVCGGTRQALGHQPPSLGLSPRVRGNLVRIVHVSALDGSIPACAGEPANRKPRRSTGRVYPRVCGGTARSCTYIYRSPGLSPRVRGNRTNPRNAGSELGSIPACAGEPVVASVLQVIEKVYPRVCGGTDSGDGLATPFEGLSPRVRGNHYFLGGYVCGMGSIPACAGEPA